MSDGTTPEGGGGTVPGGLGGTDGLGGGDSSIPGGLGGTDGFGGGDSIPNLGGGAGLPDSDTGAGAGNDASSDTSGIPDPASDGDDTFKDGNDYDTGANGEGDKNNVPSDAKPDNLGKGVEKPQDTQIPGEGAGESMSMSGAEAGQGDNASMPSADESFDSAEKPQAGQGAENKPGLPPDVGGGGLGPRSDAEKAQAPWNRPKPGN